MPDKVEVALWIQSPLYGGLLHALDTLSQAIDADLAAGRVFGTDQVTVDSCTVHNRLVLDPQQTSALEDWPHEPGAYVDELGKQPLRSGVYRPEELFDDTRDRQSQLIGGLEVIRPVRDCMTVCMELDDQRWAALVYLRCDPNRPFDDAQAEIARGLQPKLQRVVRSALHRELGSRSLMGADAGTPLPQLLARLSQTERQVLDFLRTAMTEKQIAEVMQRSPHTIHVHVKNIYRKFAITSRKELLSLFLDRPTSNQSNN